MTIDKDCFSADMRVLHLYGRDATAEHNVRSRKWIVLRQQWKLCTMQAFVKGQQGTT